MIPIYQDYFAALLLSLTNPLVLIYLGLATVHMIAARYYLKHKGGQPLAWCNGGWPPSSMFSWPICTVSRTKCERAPPRP